MCPYNGTNPFGGIISRLTQSCGGNPENNGIIGLRASEIAASNSVPIHEILDPKNDKTFYHSPRGNEPDTHGLN